MPEMIEHYYSGGSGAIDGWRCALGAVGFQNGAKLDRGHNLRIDICGEDLIVNVDREDLANEITCYKTRDHRDVPAGKRNSRTGVRCYALVFDLKQLHTVEGMLHPSQSPSWRAYVA